MRLCGLPLPTPTRQPLSQLSHLLPKSPVLSMPISRGQMPNSYGAGWVLPTVGRKYSRAGTGLTPMPGLHFLTPAHRQFQVALKWNRSHEAREGTQGWSLRSRFKSQGSQSWGPTFSQCRRPRIAAGDFDANTFITRSYGRLLATLPLMLLRRETKLTHQLHLPAGHSSCISTFIQLEPNSQLYFPHT